MAKIWGCREEGGLLQESTGRRTEGKSPRPKDEPGGEFPNPRSRTPSSTGSLCTTREERVAGCLGRADHTCVLVCTWHV